MNQDTTPVDGDDFGTLPAEQLEARIHELENQLGAARDEQVRLLAEMDNQRKRLARDVESARKYGAERVLADLLPVADSLEAGLAADPSDAAKLHEGMELTLRMLAKALDGNGLKAVDLAETLLGPGGARLPDHPRRPTPPTPAGAALGLCRRRGLPVAGQIGRASCRERVSSPV